MNQSQFDGVLNIPNSDDDDQEKNEVINYYAPESQDLRNVQQLWPQLIVVGLFYETENSKIFICEKKQKILQNQQYALKIGETVKKQLEIYNNLKHQNFTPIIDHRSNSIVMPLMKGSLRDIINQPSYKILSTKFIVSMLFQVAKALTYLYQHGIIHGDLTPSNILYTIHQQQYIFYLSDFGNSFFRKKQTNLPTQTLPYRSPEQTQTNVCWDKIDVWSLGCIIFQCITSQSLIPLQITQDNFDEALSFLTQQQQLNLKLQRFGIKDNLNTFKQILINNLLITSNKRFSVKEMFEWIQHEYKKYFY